jgi:hypothetical protein
MSNFNYERGETPMGVWDYVGMGVILMLVAFALCTLLGCGHAARRPIHIDGANIARITYEPGGCKTLVDGRILCKSVIFAMKTVSVEDLKDGK